MNRVAVRHDAGNVRRTSASRSGRSRNRPGSAGTSLVAISCDQAGWVKSPVPTTAMPLRAAHQARCSRSQSRLQALEYLEWMCRSARKREFTDTYVVVPLRPHPRVPPPHVADDGVPGSLCSRPPGAREQPRSRALRPGRLPAVSPRSRRWAPPGSSSQGGRPRDPCAGPRRPRTGRRVRRATSTGARRRDGWEPSWL